ncbi:hypothetical protein A3194_18020 [Candidatus Thiodiazotropha endoloripes]|uniref:hypothetical protein n=1 Tax=Candidatus Thiodiazotropha endoloripes TaxID=1818881 RepID=UPI00083D9A39|nr:hypothetical protein [Candidatus Thiodiazotropha endoloripes]ODB82667.1 hypothetical protein A3194_18020 [Candidatus Thiodiazotropha endoloripes]
MSLAANSLNTLAGHVAASLPQSSSAAAQNPGMKLFVRALNSSQKETLVKRQFDQTTSNQRSELADGFVSAAGEEGINQFAESIDGQYALKTVYGHAGKESRSFMEAVYERQGSTAVNYTHNETAEQAVGDRILPIAGTVNTFSSGAGAALLTSSVKLVDSIENYDGYLKQYEDLRNHKAAPVTIAKKEQELDRAFDEMSGALEDKKQPLLERNSFGTKENINQNGRVVRESVPVSNCDDAQKLMKFAKLGRIAGPALIVIDGVFRAKSVIENYNSNDPSWKREAVVQSVGFTAGMAAGVVIGAAIAFSPIGLVAGVVVGGAAAIGADIGVKVVAEKIYDWFKTRS